VIPSGLLLELSWVGDGPNPGGAGILIRTWEMTGKTKAVRKAYEDGAQGATLLACVVCKSTTVSATALEGDRS